jgi:hypothetical protein
MNTDDTLLPGRLLRRVDARICSPPGSRMAASLSAPLCNGNAAFNIRRGRGAGIAGFLLCSAQ